MKRTLNLLKKHRVYYAGNMQVTFNGHLTHAVSVSLIEFVQPRSNTWVNPMQANMDALRTNVGLTVPCSWQNS